LLPRFGGERRMIVHAVPVASGKMRALMAAS